MPLLSIRSIFNKVYDSANERLKVVISALDIEIGAVELKDATSDTRGKVAATGSIAEGDNAVAVQAPVLGATDGAAVSTDAAGTLQQYLRGLVKLIVTKIGITIANGDDAATGTTTDAAVKTAATGTVIGHLRGLKELIIDKIGVTVADGDNTVLGTTSDAGVVTDAAGTVQQYLRGLIKLIVAKIGVTVADGDDTAVGATTDAAVKTAATGSVIAHLRGIKELIIDKIGITIADGDDTATGATTDAAVKTAATGSVIAHLRGIKELIIDGISAAISIADGSDVALGATTDAAVKTAATGTLISHLRGLKELIIDKIGVTVADGDDVALGATTDAAVKTAATGSLIAHLRGLKELIIDKITVNIQVGGVAPGMDDTDKIAASMHGKDAADGDTPLVVRVVAASADVHEPAANTAAVVTYAGVGGEKHVITGFAWSYTGGIPAGGNLKVEDVLGTTVFSMDITEEGAGIITFPKPKKGAAVNTAMIVTLAAGGAGVTGKLSVLNHWTEA